VETPESTEDRARKFAMTELGDLLDLRASDTGKPAARAADFKKYEMVYTAAYPRVKNQEIVVLFGAPIDKGASDKVLAYEKDVPTSGGYVLMQDGTTVKTMTAEEFKDAPKAPGTAPQTKAAKNAKK
jgi:hypothetical protein